MQSHYYAASSLNKHKELVDHSVDYAEPNSGILSTVIGAEKPKAERKAMTEKLKTGDVFPSLSLKIAGGEEFSIPGDLESSITIVLFYRGHW